MSVIPLSPGLRVLGRPRTQAVRTAAAERRHDALQSMATMSALLAAAVETAGDAQLTRRRLAQIDAEVHTLRELVHGTRATSPQVVDVAAEARQLVGSLSVEYAGAVGVVARAGAPARVAATALHRILGNLVRNAMRAAGSEGRVLVTVESAADEVVVLVEDDGPGLGALTVVNGLGLRSVRRLVHEAGGRMETRARGRLGGASIRIHLPMLRSELVS